MFRNVMQILKIHGALYKYSNNRGLNKIEANIKLSKYKPLLCLKLFKFNFILTDFKWITFKKLVFKKHSTTILLKFKN